MLCLVIFSLQFALLESSSVDDDLASLRKELSGSSLVLHCSWWYFLLCKCFRNHFHLCCSTLTFNRRGSFQLVEPRLVVAARALVFHFGMQRLRVNLMNYEERPRSSSCGGSVVGPSISSFSIEWTLHWECWCYFGHGKKVDPNAQSKSEKLL